MRWRGILVGIGIVAVMPIVALVIFIGSFNANGWKPRIQEAMMRATGRELSLNGPISVRWSLVPIIQARDVALANIEGGSRPQMVSAQGIELEVALLPLLSNRVDIRRLVVLKPDILIETTQENHGNWEFTKPATPAPAATQGRALEIEVESIKVEGGTLTWHDAVNGQKVMLALQSFELLEPSETSSITFELVATYSGTQFAAHGETGSMALLRNTAEKAPWPAKMTLITTGAEVSVEGQFASPVRPASFSGEVSGKLADLAPLRPFLPRTPLPSVKGLNFGANVTSSSLPLMGVTDATLHAGESDFSSTVPGLTLTHIDVRLPRLDQPVTAEADGNYADAPLQISAMLGAPSTLIGGRAVPAYVSLGVAGATATVKGTLADPVHLTGAELVLSARIPTLALFATLVRRPLPDLTDITLNAHLAEAQGGFANGIALTQARLNLPQGDIAGDASVTFARFPSITGNVTSQRIDLDSLLEVKSVNPKALLAPALPPKGGGSPNLLISDTPLDLGVLRNTQADVQLHIAEMRAGGQMYRDILGKLVLKNGKLALDPISGRLPAGRMSGRLAIDANPPNPTVALVLHAPGLSLRTLALTLGQSSSASGSLELDVNLNGAGNSLHAIAAAMNGTVGLAMVNGEIDNASLNSLLGPILTSASLPLSLINPGQNIRGNSTLRCFAARLDVLVGLGTFRALYLDSARVKVRGGGTVNLADETLSLRLQPLARLADTGITVPLIVGGTIKNPKTRIDVANSAQANLKGLAQSAKTLAEVPLGRISGALGGPDRFSGGGDDCASQLEIARGGPGGPQPNAPPSLLAVPADAAKQILKVPKNLMQNLFSK